MDPDSGDSTSTARSPIEITFINNGNKIPKNILNNEIHILQAHEEQLRPNLPTNINTITIDNCTLATYLEIELKNNTLMIDKTEIICKNTLEAKLSDRNQFTLKKQYCKICDIHRFEKNDHQQTPNHLKNAKDLQESFQPKKRKTDRNLALQLITGGAEYLTDEVHITNDGTHDTVHQIKIWNTSLSSIIIDSVQFEDLAGYSSVSMNSTSTKTKNTTTYKLGLQVPRQSYLTNNNLFIILSKNVTASYCHNLDFRYTLDSGERVLETLKVRTKKLFGFYRYDKNTKPRITWNWIKTDKNISNKPTNPETTTLQPPSEEEYNAYMWLILDRNTRVNNSPTPRTTQVSNKILQICQEPPTPENFKTRNRHINNLEYHEYLKGLEATATRFLSSQVTESGTKETITIQASSDTMSHLRLNRSERVLIRYQEDLKHKVVHGTIDNIGTNTTKIKLDYVQHVNLNEDCYIEVTPTIRIQCFLINQKIIEMFDNNIKQFIFPQVTTTSSSDKLPEINYIQDNLDEDQKQFLRKCSHHQDDCPIILDGPAGTGKSAVVMDIVLQAKQQEKKCLVTCPTNAAVLDWFTRLHSASKKYTPMKIIKLASTTAPITEECIKYNCKLNDDNTQHAQLEYEDLIPADVILTTQQSAIKLVNMGKKGEAMKHIEVQCIIVDEAAFSTEINTLTPIISQLHARWRRIKVVLLGDRNQLTYSSKSDVVNRGYTTDLMTRLKDSKLYQNNPNLSHSLKTNYRSRPEICQLSNDLVYEGKLIATRPKGGKIVAIHADTDKNSGEITYSNYSIPDLVATLEIVRQIREEHPSEGIMIVCIYRAQQQIITKYLYEKGILDVPIVIAESAQGGSCTNVIVSLAAKDNTTWMSNKKRMSMIVTRAKDNLYLIGDLISCCNAITTRSFLDAAIKQNNLRCPDNIREYIHNRLDLTLTPTPSNMDVDNT